MCCPGGDHLVGIHVRRCAGSGLEHVERELLVPIAVRDLEGRQVNGMGDLCIKQPEAGVHFGGNGLDEPQRADEIAGKADPAHGKVLDGTGGLGAVEGGAGDGHFAHAVAFDAGGAHKVLRRIVLKPRRSD